ncbi:SusC/RagA family TonB-linked outer membrane protein [Chitinophaga deserti]|uniref:SusC/RagA family TonB-linked outer membrane protein n=1 Tax=Chitinophaga deserti TaxID=2164099 RepID=UPI0013008EB7|nr:SusC/RagA family TonB-linked outer membrane protein [Chitinophaga deserti]
MKLSTIFLLTGFLHVSATASSQRVTLAVRNAPLTDVFKAIQRQSGYIVFYNNDLMSRTVPVTVNVNDLPVRDVLEQVLEPQGLNFTIEDKTVILLAMPRIRAVAPVEIAVTITGRVTDAGGAPLAGVSVKVKGSVRGALTNENGEFQLTGVAPGAVLEFTFIGFTRQEVALGGRTAVNIRLQPESSKLEAVQVVNTGYQTISAERATGSFSFISPARLEAKLRPDLRAALEGQAAGVVISKEGNVEIRGVSTITAERKPLLVVDGYPTQGDLESINIDNIESITVLKDAVAASIYGARSSNGVIVITTRKGRPGSMRVQYRGSTGITLKPQVSYLNRATPADYIDAETDLFNQDPSSYLNTYNTYGSLSEVNYLLLAKNQGWKTEKEVDDRINQLKNTDAGKLLEENYFRHQFNQQHNISLSGGNEKNSLNAALRYITNDNNTIGNSDNRLILDFKNDWRPVKNLGVSLFTNVNYATTKAPVRQWSDLFAFTSTSLVQPYSPVVDADGNPSQLFTRNVKRDERYALIPGLKPLYYNPLEDLMLETTNTQNLLVRFGGNVQATIINGLTAELGGNWSRGYTNSRSVYDKNSYRMRLGFSDATSIANPAKHYIPDGAMVNESRGATQYYMLRGQLGYNRNIGLKHYVAAIAGMEISQAKTDNNTYPTRFGYNDQAGTFATFNHADYNAGLYNSDMLGGNRPSASIGSISFGDNRFVSWYANGSYEYDGRFILSGSIRLDQTNFFGTDPKFRYKPLWSAGGTYKLGKEKFFDVAWINKLNIRGSYGVNGNISLTSGPFLIIAPTSFSILTGDVNYNISSPPNNSLRWEKTNVFNAGTDIGAFNNRLRLTLDYYRKLSTDVLASDAMDPTKGFTSQVKNAGKILNQGFEISLEGDVVKKKDFIWNSQFIFAYNKNTVKEYNVAYIYPSSLTNAAIRKEGDPLDALYAYRYAGLDNNGVAQFYDSEGKKTGGGNAKVGDLVYAGTLRPPYVMSMTNTFSYKNFDFSFMIIARTGNVLRRDAFTGSNYINKHVAERWRKPGDEAHTIYPKLTAWNMDMFYFPYSDVLVESANFAKLRDVTFAYTLPQSILKRAGIKDSKVYFQSRNLVMITANSDRRDPEISEINTSGGTGAFTEQGFTSLPLRPELYVGIMFTL